MRLITLDRAQARYDARLPEDLDEEQSELETSQETLETAQLDLVVPPSDEEDDREATQFLPHV
jgi:hypothetical protein